MLRKTSNHCQLFCWDEWRGIHTVEILGNSFTQFGTNAHSSPVWLTLTLRKISERTSNNTISEPSCFPFPNGRSDFVRCSVSNGLSLAGRTKTKCPVEADTHFKCIVIRELRTKQPILSWTFFCSTPGGNTMSAAELTCTYILAISRFVEQFSGFAATTVSWEKRKGIWNRECWLQRSSEFRSRVLQDMPPQRDTL